MLLLTEKKMVDCLCNIIVREGPLEKLWGVGKVHKVKIMPEKNECKKKSYVSSTNNTKISMHWPKKIHARYTHANLIPSVFSIALI